MADILNLNFVAADNTELYVKDANWKGWTRNDFWGSLSNIKNNRVNGTSWDGACYRYDQALGTADYEVSADVYRDSSDNVPIYLLARITGTGAAFTAYALKIEGTSATGTFTLSKFIGNVETVIGTASGSLPSVGAAQLLRLRCAGGQISVYSGASGTPIISVADASISGAGLAGFVHTGVGGFGFTIADFVVSDLAVADTTAPTLSAASATAVSHTTATGSITTDEAGPARAVVTTSATKPSAPQVKAGQDHTGAAAAAADTADLVVGANAPAFAFTGLSGSTAYYLHVVQDDTATPSNTSTVATSASFATPAAPKRATITLTTDGTTPAASVTGLRGAWWDSYPPDLTTLPVLTNNALALDASGVLDWELTGTTLAVAGTGTLLLLKGGGVEGETNNVAFCGPVEVS